LATGDFKGAGYFAKEASRVAADPLAICPDCAQPINPQARVCLPAATA